MSGTVHLVVESGGEEGRQLSVPAQGARLGRSSKNDIVLLDPLLSRHHCRLYFKPAEGLWAADLGSANQTMVNGQPIQETRLRVGDRVAVGNTVLRVVADTLADSDLQTTALEPVVDLGLRRGDHASAPARPLLNRQLLLGILTLVAVFALAGWGWKLLGKQTAAPIGRQPTPSPAAPNLALEVNYEKVLADAQNIFRYHLRIDAGGVIAVQIDDVQNDRHVRKEGEMDPAYLTALAESLLGSGFFKLQEVYQGIQPDLYNLWDLTVTIGRRTHRCRVVNRVEPEIFREMREKLEDTGKSELGLWAIQFSPEKLVEMANDAYLVGKKMLAEREVDFGNLAAALKSFTEADWYLETVEPKPDFYPEVVSRAAECKRLLDEKYENQNFLAERAIRVRNWEEAARELRVLCEIIPDRGDPRNREARRKLLEIETRLRLQK